MKQQDIFLQLIDTGSKAFDAAFRYAFQKEMRMQQLLTNEELDRLAEKVIQRISITMDASDIVNEIETIKQAIESLGGTGGKVCRK